MRPPNEIGSRDASTFVVTTCSISESKQTFKTAMEARVKNDSTLGDSIRGLMDIGQDRPATDARPVLLATKIGAGRAWLKENGS